MLFILIISLLSLTYDYTIIIIMVHIRKKDIVHGTKSQYLSKYIEFYIVYYCIILLLKSFIVLSFYVGGYQIYICVLGSQYNL